MIITLAWPSLRSILRNPRMLWWWLMETHLAPWEVRMSSVMSEMKHLGFSLSTQVTDDNQIIVEFIIPNGVRKKDVVRLARQYALLLDEKHRELGGSGLKVQRSTDG